LQGADRSVEIRNQSLVAAGRQESRDLRREPGTAQCRRKQSRKRNRRAELESPAEERLRAHLIAHRIHIPPELYRVRPAMITDILQSLIMTLIRSRRQKNVPPEIPESFHIDFRSVGIHGNNVIAVVVEHHPSVEHPVRTWNERIAYRDRAIEL